MRVLFAFDAVERKDYVETVQRRMQEYKVTVVLADPNEPLMQRAQAEGARAIILMVSEPLDLIQTLRRDGFEGALLVEQTEPGRQQVIDAYNTGADEVMVQPVHPGVRYARLQALLRRLDRHATTEVRIGDLLFPLDGRDVMVNDQPVILTAKEHQVLECLALRPNRAQSRQSIIQHVYGSGADTKDTKIIDVYVCKLREKLKQADSRTTEIRTVFGTGYMLGESLEREAAEAPIRAALG